MLTENQKIRLEITDVTCEGKGVGRYEGIVVFVPHTAVGDVIECKIVHCTRSVCYGEISKIITPSAARIQSDCNVFTTEFSKKQPQCGGCLFRHITYEEECRLKEKFVRDAFERIGGLHPEFEPILPCERVEKYRNKAQYPVVQRGKKAVCGFYARQSHNVIESYDCALQPEIFGEILKAVIFYANENKIKGYDEKTGRGDLRHIYLRRGEHSGEIMVCLVVTSLKICEKFSGLGKFLVKNFPQIKSIVLNENPKKTNVILGRKNKVIFGSEYITDEMCGRKFSISPHSFYQVNTLQAEKLYAVAGEYAAVKENEILLDLYCGVGTIGLSLCKNKQKLIGVEIIPQAIENAKRNAQLNNVKNTEFICGDAGKIAEILYERGERPEVIIADPARKGCDEKSIEAMVKMNPSRIVIVSCNPSTAARDCARLNKLGYHPTKVRAVDMFPRTGHVECVVNIQRNTP